jgi:hypothetical protein
MAEKISQFSHVGRDTNLDRGSFVGNNTHELIVLPRFGRVLLAKRIGSRLLRILSKISGQSSESNGRLSAIRKFLGRGVSVEASLACGVARAFLPQLSESTGE